MDQGIWASRIEIDGQEPIEGEPTPFAQLWSEVVGPTIEEASAGEHRHVVITVWDTTPGAASKPVRLRCEPVNG